MASDRASSYPDLFLSYPFQHLPCPTLSCLAEAMRCDAMLLPDPWLAFLYILEEVDKLCPAKTRK